MTNYEKDAAVASESDPRPVEEGRDVVPLDQVPKGRWERSWPTIACGAGLFSDGYLNGVSYPMFLRVGLLHKHAIDARAQGSIKTKKLTPSRSLAR